MRLRIVSMVAATAFVLASRADAQPPRVVAQATHPYPDADADAPETTPSPAEPPNASPPGASSREESPASSSREPREEPGATPSPAAAGDDATTSSSEVSASPSSDAAVRDAREKRTFDDEDVVRGNDATRTVQEAPPTHEGRFEFGSYGRVGVASDLRGSLGRGTNVVAFGPRIVDEGSYAELELRREDKFSDKVKARIVATLALFPPFFHFSGDATQAIGLRNLYAQGSYGKVTIWAGSRMYRGDDIYLLNWWPLDNQNTVGGGVGAPVYQSADGVHETIAQAHVGQQRLDNPYQFQQIPVVAPIGFGTVDVTKLDRPRTIETFKLTHFVRPGAGPAGFKAILYGELHQLAAGVYRDPLTNVDRGLPNDSGWMLGSQLTYFTGQRDTFASLVARHARGIAAYDPFAVPITFAVDRTVTGASETQFAASGHFETDLFGVMAAGYVRFFRDDSPGPTSTQTYDEGAVVARPSLFLGEHFGVSVEGSYQQRRIAIQDPNGEGPLAASVFKAGVMPYFSPSGRGSFKRPQIRLLYVVSVRDSATRGLYAAEDVFARRGVEHFAGLGAEWWFNSSSYP